MEPTVKDGYKTTEFYLVIVSNLILIVGALNSVLDRKTSEICLTALNAVYAVLRTYAKAPPPVPPDTVVVTGTQVTK